jgi:hypothetical protein
MSLSRKDILAGAVALLLVLVVAAVSNWSSLTSSITTSNIRSDVADYARTAAPVDTPPVGQAEASAGCGSSMS